MAFSEIPANSKLQTYFYSLFYTTNSFLALKSTIPCLIQNKIQQFSTSIKSCVVQ